MKQRTFTSYDREYFETLGLVELNAEYAHMRERLLKRIGPGDWRLRDISPEPGINDSIVIAVEARKREEL